jgi:hypothetical protein
LSLADVKAVFMVFLGYDVNGDEGSNNVWISDRARRQGVYLIGNTGTGKTTVLQNMAYQALMDKNRPGMCVIDPHGDLTEELLHRVPKSRRDDVILFAPGDDDQVQQPLGLNIFDCNRDDPREVRRVASTVVDTLKKLFFYSWGPRMEDVLRHSVLTLLEQEDTTFLELMLLLADKDHRKRLTADVRDPVLRHFLGCSV